MGDLSDDLREMGIAEEGIPQTEMICEIFAPVIDELIEHRLDAATTEKEKRNAPYDVRDYLFRLITAIATQKKYIRRANEWKE